MLPDPQVAKLSSSQNRIFQHVDEILLSMEPIMNVETDNGNIEDIEQNTVCLFIFAMSMSYIVEKLN